MIRHVEMSESTHKAHFPFQARLDRCRGGVYLWIYSSGTPRFTFLAKGVNSKYKTGPGVVTTHDAMERFEQHLDQVLDLTHVTWDGFWIDVAKEYSAAAPSRPYQPHAQVYLPRKCCLQSYV
jgi:hypothetical protein